MSDIRILSQLLDADHAAADPTAEAITDGTQRLTWAEYRDRVARLAGVLIELGVTRGDRVGVHLLKSTDSWIAVHAILRAGAAMVPLDALAPPTHTAAVLADAGAEVMITAARPDALRAITDGSPVRRVIGLTQGAEAPVGVELRRRDDIDETSPAAMVPVDPDDLAYVMYTSGSTGRPKGMAHTHRSGLAYARLAAETYDLTAADRLANIAPLHFDQSTFELYAAPLAGASVLIVPDGVLRFPASLAKLIAAEAITVWYSVPYVLDQLSARGAIGEHDLSSLRWVLYGGEAFPPATLARVMADLPSARFSNVYGPAEVNQCTFFHLDEPPAGDEPVPIGAAWTGAELLVVDEDDRVVEPGEPGELLVRTETMMRGYWNRPDLDAASIVERADTGPGRWYRTGDLVRARPDGALVFLGRIDNQVKVRGHRIEIEAVEAALVDQPGVDAGAVLVERPAGGDDHLVAVVSPAAATADGGDTTLLLALAALLPRYAVPTRVIGLDDLPRTGTGKVDRRATAAAVGITG